jgi:hypothetical protein
VLWQTRRWCISVAVVQSCIAGCSWLIKQEKLVYTYWLFLLLKVTIFSLAACVFLPRHTNIYLLPELANDYQMPIEYWLMVCNTALRGNTAFLFYIQSIVNFSLPDVYCIIINNSSTF